MGLSASCAGGEPTGLVASQAGAVTCVDLAIAIIGGSGHHGRRRGAFGAWHAATKANEASHTMAAIERDWRYDELTPDFDVTIFDETGNAYGGHNRAALAPDHGCRVRRYTASTDTNHLLGRQGEYTSKVNWGANQDNPIEVFTNLADAQARQQCLSAFRPPFGDGYGPHSRHSVAAALGRPDAEQGPRAGSAI